LKKIWALFIIFVFFYILTSLIFPVHAETKQLKVAIIDNWSEYLLDPRGRVIWGYSMREENLPANWLKEALEVNGFYVKIIKLYNTTQTGVSINFSEFDVLIIWRGDFRFSTELVDKIKSANKPLLLIGFAGDTFLDKVYDFNDRGQPSAHLSTFDTMYIHVPSNTVRHAIYNIPNRINIENGLVRIASSNIQVYACEIKKTANIDVLATLPNNEDYAPFVIYYNPDIYAIFWGFNTYNSLKQDFDYQKDLLINMVYYLSHEKPINYLPDNREKVRTVNPTDPNKATPPLLWTYTTIGPMGGTIWAAAVSKNGTYIVAGGNDGFVYLFHRSNNVPLWIFDTRSRVRSIDISHKGYVVVGADSGELFVLDINSLKLMHKYYLRSEYYFRPYLRGIAVSISKDEDFIAAVRGYKVFLFKIGVASPLWEYFSQDDQFISVDISNDGSYIVVGSYSIYSKSKVIIFSRSSSKPLLVYEVPRAVASVAISGDGNYVVAGSEDNNVYFFSVKEKRLLWTYQTHGYVWAVSISNDGKYVVAASLDGKIYALSGLSGKMIWSYQAGEPSPPNTALGLWSVDISSDGKYCVTGTAEPYGYVYLFDCINGELIWRQYLPEAIRTVSISDDGSTIVAGTVGVKGVSGVIGVYTSVQISSTILVADTVPFDRLFPINVRVKNFYNVKLLLRVVLEERTGFQAGSIYGDGDEIKDITLNPYEEVELSFKAKVYGVPRVKDVARFKFYVGGKFIEQKDQSLNLNSEFVEVLSFTCPAIVKKGSKFTVGVPIFYSFAMDTTIVLTLTNEEDGRKLTITDIIKGEGFKIYSFAVDASFANINSEGIRSFMLTVQAEYPEENDRVVYKKEFVFKVRISNNVGSSSILMDSGFIITLNYKGKQYFALCAYNATESQPPNSGKIEDIIRWAYSRRNWLVFETINGNFKPVIDNEIYKTLAFASEITYLRATMWNEDNLLSSSNYFKKLGELAVLAESLNFVSKLAGKFTGIIGLQAANAWASSVSSGIEVSTKTRDLAMTTSRVIQILNELKFYEDALAAINKVGASEEALIWVSIFLLNGGSTDLEDANKLLNSISLPAYPPVSIRVNVDEALTFYKLIQSGETKCLSGMRFLSMYYAKDQIDVMGIKLNIRPFKTAFTEALGVVGSAYDFYENLKNKFNIPEVFEFAQHLVTVWDEYEVRKEACQSASLKFRDTYIKETSNSIDVTLTEPETQHKLYLTIYDSQERIVGFNRATNTIESEIPGSYYIDFENTIKVSIPLNVKIEKIVVNAMKAKLSIENYTLRVEVYRNGNLIGNTTLSSQINANTQKEYTLQLTEDSKPTLKETAPYTPLQYIIIPAIISLILAISTLTLIIKRKTRTSISRQSP
jgi:WD40 repeat protein